MNESRATRYQRGLRLAQLAGMLSGWLLLILLAFTPAGAALAGWATRVGMAWLPSLGAATALVLFTGAVAALWEIAWLPAVWYLSPRADGRAGRRAGLGEALGAQAQAWVGGTAAALAAASAVGIAVRVAGPWWWAAAGALVAAGLAAAMHIVPGVIARWSGARPVERPALVEVLGALARQVRVPIASIDALPDSAAVTATALVAGAGAGRRVFIAHELMRDWSDEEIAVVVAHELAHHAHHDLWRTLAFDVCLLSMGLWTAAGSLRATGLAPDGVPADLAALPAVALVASAVWLVAAPVRHALSRRQERRADVFALTLTGASGAFQAAIRRLAARHLAEERPSRVTRWFFHGHPSPAERLRLAAEFEGRAPGATVRRQAPPR